MPLDKINVKTLLSGKEHAVHCIVETSSVQDTVNEMNRLRIGSLMVKNASGEVVGIFTERDILVRVISSELDPRSTPVQEVMTSGFTSIRPDCPLEEAMQIMTEKRVRHLPVLSEGELCGMISIGDVTRWLLEVNEMEAENLRRYVFSDYPG
jgi:CBS domain-containing protein